MVSGRSLLWKLPVFAAAAVLAGLALANGLVRAAAEIGHQALVKEAGAACQIASTLEQSRVVWSSPDYQNHAALIVTGKWPEARNDGAPAYMLCLFNKHDAKVQLQEIDPAIFR